MAQLQQAAAAKRRQGEDVAAHLKRLRDQHAVLPAAQAPAEGGSAEAWEALAAAAEAQRAELARLAKERRAFKDVQVCVRLASTERATARVMQEGSAARKIRHEPRPEHTATGCTARRTAGGRAPEDGGHRLQVRGRHQVARSTHKQAVCDRRRRARRSTRRAPPACATWRGSRSRRRRWRASSPTWSRRRARLRERCAAPGTAGQGPESEGRRRADAAVPAAPVHHRHPPAGARHAHGRVRRRRRTLREPVRAAPARHGLHPGPGVAGCRAAQRQRPRHALPADGPRGPGRGAGRVSVAGRPDAALGRPTHAGELCGETAHACVAGRSRPPG